MQGAGTAKRDHGVTSRVAASLHGHHAHGVFHIASGNEVNAPGRVTDRQTERFGYLLTDSTLGRHRIQLHLTAIEPLRRDVTEHHVGVGNGRLSTALAVAYGAWRSTGTVGSDGNHTHLHSGDAASARANFQQFHRGDVDR